MSGPSKWAGKWIGIPFKENGRDRSGFDCWGLARAILEWEFGIGLPSFDTTGTEEKEVASAAISLHCDHLEWIDVPRAEVEPGDLVLLRIGGVPCHVGVVCNAPFFVHVHRGMSSAIDRFDGLKWDQRIETFKRHKDLAS